jgi:hypothetical protein
MVLGRFDEPDDGLFEGGGPGMPVGGGTAA